MITIRFFRAVILALFFSSTVLDTALAAPDGAQATDEAWRKAVIANDLNAIIAVYAEDAVMWLPDAPEARGRDNIRKAYADLFAANTVTGATLTNTHYETSGNLSVGWGNFTLTLSPKAGGTPVTMSGRFSVIAKKQGGTWVYAVDHASGEAASSTAR